MKLLRSSFQTIALRNRALLAIARATDDPANALGLDPSAEGVADAVQAVNVAITLGCIPGLFDCPPVTRFAEGVISNGRADFVLFHQDGSATCVEIAEDRNEQFVLDGLPRLFSRAVLIGHAIDPAPVRSVLACNCPVLGSVQRAITCRVVGVHFVRLSTNAERRERLHNVEARKAS